MGKQHGFNYPAILTFVIVLVVFGALNLWTLSTLPECCDQLHKVGFPLRFFESGGFSGDTRFYPALLFLDIVISLAAATSVAWAVARIFKGDGTP